MPRQVIWTDDAEEDLAEIARYIAEDSTKYSEIVLKKIEALTVNLADFEWAGRKVPELEDETLRERFVYNYRIIYRISDDDTIKIAAIIHGSRLLEPFKETILAVHEEEAVYAS